MDPCDPGTDIKNARSYLHIKMGIPKSLVQGASREAICLALKRCKRANGMAMPPMDYDRVGKHRIYYSNPRGIDLRGKDYKDLLVGRPSFKVLKRIADKLGLVSDDKDMLKGLIIKRLKTAGAPEPLMVPIKKARRTPTTVNGLKNMANALLQKPPSMVIAKNLSKNITSPQVRRNVASIQKSFNRAVAAEQRLQQAVQKPGVTKEELANTIKKVQQTQVPRVLKPLNQLRLARMQRLQQPVQKPGVTKKELANTIKKVQQTQVPRVLKPLNQLRLARMQNMQRTAAPAPAPVPRRELVNLAKKQKNIVNIEKALRSRNNFVIRAIKNASYGNKNAIKLLSNTNRGQLRVIQRRAREAEAAAERAQNGAEAAQERAESANNMKEMAKAAAEATEKSKEAIMATKSMIDAQNEAALLKAMKNSDANKNKNESTGGRSSNNALRNLREDMRVGPAGKDQDIVEMAIKDTDKKYLNILKKVDPKLLKKAVKKVYGEGRFFKNNGQRAYLNALMKASNVNTLDELSEQETNNNTNSHISDIKEDKQTNNMQATVENRIKMSGNAENIRKTTEQAKMGDQKISSPENIRGLNHPTARTGVGMQSNNNMKELTRMPTNASAELEMNKNNNTSRLQGILNKLKGAPSDSTNKLNVLSENNKNFLQKTNDNKLKDQLLKNAKLALAQKATAVVTDQA